MDTLSKISNLLKCQDCPHHLSGPVKFHLEKHIFLCKRCSEKYQDTEIENNDYLNQIGELLEFPCYYKNLGCREVCMWKEAELHEKSCPFREYFCPSTGPCSWKGPLTNMREHFVSIHTQITDASNFNFADKQENCLIEYGGELFVFQMEIDVEEDMMWYDVRFLGSPLRAPRFHFKVELFIDEENRKYVERKQVESDDTWTLDKNQALGIRIAMVKAMLKNADEINLKVKIDIRQPLYNGKADEALLHEVECPVCKDHMIRPIRMCKSGHNICNNCYQKLTDCPSCRGPLSETRNISLETLSDQMHYRCMYYDQGCTFTDVPANIKEHEMFCEVSYYDCPLKQLVNCQWRGKVGHVCIHASKEHQFKF